MKSFLQFAIIAATAVPSASVLCAQESVITTPPAGREVECYADFRSFQNVFDFVWDSHSTAKIVYTDDGKAYIPNVLMRNTMANYVVALSTNRPRLSPWMPDSPYINSQISTAL